MGSGVRRLKVGVRTAKGRKSSSTRWLQRQLNDSYVAQAHERGLRSRAAFKLMELDDRFHFLGPGKRVVDLGAAPGGWTQVTVARVRSDGRGAGKAGRGRVVALDILGMEPVPGAMVIQADMFNPNTSSLLREELGGPADVVISDLAPNATGHVQTDHLRIIALVEAALAFACEVLASGGVFVAKVTQGGAHGALLATLKRDFAKVRHAKPAASRPESREAFVVALGFRGGSQ